MHHFRVVSILLVIALLALLAVSVSAQDMPAPSVTVSDQLSLNGTVTVASAYSEGPGFVVIHVDNGAGEFGSVAGFRWVNPGWNYNIRIRLDPALASPTPLLFAMLHVDTGEVGTYEFGTVEGADGPVVIDGAVVSPAFTMNGIRMTDQFLDGNTVTANWVTSAVDGFLVIHADDNGTFGPVLGYTAVAAGTTNGVAVEVAEEGRTEVLWPMLHVDTGAAGTYEFGTVSGADGPVVVDGQVASFPIWTVPHVRVADQIVTNGDAMAGENMSPMVVAESVLSEGPGFLVIHQEADGGPGPVAGVSDPLPAGLSTNVQIVVDPALATPNLWPMLHVDTGTEGVYEFGTVEGADGPVVVNGNVVTFPIFASPAQDLANASFDAATSTISIPKVFIDGPGWVAIHSNNEGAPGPVIATYPLLTGANWNISIPIDVSMAGGDQVFPMLHYDDNTVGTYEFGTVEGADAPVFVGGNVVVGPLSIAG